MRVLYVSYQDPFGIGGGCYASHAYLKAFSTIADGNVDVVIAEECDESKDVSIIYKSLYKVPQRKKISRAFSLFSGVLHRYDSFVKNLLRNDTTRYDYVVFSGCLVAGTLAKQACKYGAKVVTIHHNYEPEYYRDNMRDGMKKRLLITQVRRAERKAFKNSDFNFFLTRSDMNMFDKVYGKCEGKNHLIATFEFSDVVLNDPKKESTQLTFVITVTLSTYQGIDGIKFFFDDLYCKLPYNSKVIIAGSSPSTVVQELCLKHSNVELVPNPLNMDDVLNKADIYICPTRLGGGMKLRVMDGLKHGMPVIVHKCSARGYDLFYDTPAFTIFETSDDFEKKLDQLITEKMKGLVKPSEVMDLYQKNFSLRAGTIRIKTALNI